MGKRERFFQRGRGKVGALVCKRRGKERKRQKEETERIMNAEEY